MDIPTTRPANADDRLTESERALTISCMIIVALTVGLRALGRWCLKRRFERMKVKTEEALGMDDLFNVFAVVTFYGLCIAVLIAIDRGMGAHISLVLYERGIKGLSDYSQAIYVSAVFYNTTLGMIKLSVLSLYRRILKGVQSNVIRVIVWVVFGMVAFNTLANVLVAIFQCWPISAAWDQTITEKKCININAFYLGNAITGTTTDAMVYFLSIPIVKPLQMDVKTKLQIMCTMLIGAFAVVTSAVRLGFIPSLLKNPDATMAMGVPMDWSIVEPTVGILVSSMPAIRAIRYLWIEDKFNSYSGSGSALKSGARNKDGHIQLYDVESKNRTTVGTGSGKNDYVDDNNSEERLVFGTGKGLTGISRTTEVELSYQDK